MQPAASVAGNSRIQKNTRRSTVVNAFSLEKALQIGQDAETDTSSTARTPTEGTPSNEASPPSSVSSTPRVLPEQKKLVSSCCKPKSPPPPSVPKANCCSSKANPQPQSQQPPEQAKPCCSGSNTSATTPPQPPPTYQHFGQQFHFQTQSQVQNLQFHNFQSHIPSPALCPFGLGVPIYNHAAAAYQQHGPVPMSSIPQPSGPHFQRAPEHNCHCGESCSCFGCAAHPNNATMMEYVRLMAQFQYTGGFGAMSPPLYDMPTYPHHPGFGAEANQAIDCRTMAQAMMTPTPTQLGFPPGMGMQFMGSAPMPHSGSWQQPPLSTTAMSEPQPLEPGEYTLASPVEGQISQTGQDAAETPAANSPSDGSREEDTPTLSPSSYFWNEMTLPSCSDATGTCQCGDGCACVGCITHGGHNGLQLEDASPGEHEALSEFAPDTVGLGLDDASADFMKFHATPT